MKIFEDYSEQFKSIKDDKSLLRLYEDAPHDTLVANAISVGVFIATLIICIILSSIEAVASSNVFAYIILALFIVCAVFSTKAGIEHPITARGIIATEIKQRHPEYNLGNNKYLYVRKCAELNGLDKSVYEVNKKITTINIILFILSYLINILVRGLIAAFIVIIVGMFALLFAAFSLVAPGASTIKMIRDKLFKVIFWAVKFFFSSFKIQIHEIKSINYNYPQTEEQKQYKKDVERDKYIGVCDYLKYSDLQVNVPGGYWVKYPEITNFGNKIYVKGEIAYNKEVDVLNKGDLKNLIDKVQDNITKICNERLNQLYAEHPYADKMQIVVTIEASGLTKM